MAAPTIQLTDTQSVPVETWRRRPLDYRQYRLRQAADSDCSRVQTEPVVVHEAGRVRIAYLHLDRLGRRFDELVSLLRAVRYATTQRTTGMTSTSRVFGFEPRKTLRKDYCSTTSLLQDAPEAFLALARTTLDVEEWYKKVHPNLYAQHLEIARNRVRPEWRLGQVFTSGIVNFNNQLPYHFDSGNFSDVWSGMLVFKGAGITGGYLAVPEYDVAFALPDHSLFMFDGQGLLHGVTPFQQTQPDSYRISVVWYSLKGMWQCLAPVSETERINVLRTQREDARS